MNAYSVNTILQKLVSQLDVDIIAYDYQGYGFSEGTPTEETCYEDLEVVIKNAKENYDKIYLIGHSIGTGIVAHHISINDWITPVMLISPYKSIISIVTDKMSCYIRNLVYIFDIFSTIDKIKNSKCKIKIIHGLDDDLISCNHSKAICKIINDKTMEPIFMKNTGHNDILDKIDIKTFKEFINL